MRAKLVCAWIFVLGALAAVVDWVTRRDARERAAREEAYRRGEELKAKVAEIKAGQAARREATDAAVAKVDEAVQVDSARDPVELANDLVADARRGKG